MANKEIFKRTSELDYVPPAGEWDYLANVSHIVNKLLTLYPNTNIELSTKEFGSFMAIFNGEVMVSLLLDKRFEDKKRAGINSIFKEGFEFRGIKVRVRD